MSPRISQLSPSGSWRVTDLTLVCILLIATVILVRLDGPTVLRVPFVLLFVLFAPGYSFTVALFPASKTAPSDSEERIPSLSEGSVTVLERLVLSVALSLAVVSLTGIILDWGVGRITVETLLIGNVAVTITAVILAVIRRQQVPVAVRYAPGFSFRRKTTETSTWSYPDGLTVIVVLSVLLAGSAVAYSQTAGNQSPSMTEFYLLTESEDGDLQTTNYPTAFTRGTSRPLSLGVRNIEGETTTYTLIGQLQRVERHRNTTVVQDRKRISHRRLQLPGGERRVLNETILPETPEVNRLVFLLYQGEAPTNPRMDNAYREVHLWITVSE
jgi:uncharacterized membrane protein